MYLIKETKCAVFDVDGDIRCELAAVVERYPSELTEEARQRYEAHWLVAGVPKFVLLPEVSGSKVFQPSPDGVTIFEDGDVEGMQEVGVLLR